MGEFTKHTSIIVLMTVLRFAIAFAGSVLLARTLGPGGMGQYAVLFLVAAFAVKIANLGMEPATVFHVGKKDYTLKTIFGNTIIAGLGIGLLASAAALLFVLLFRHAYASSIPAFYFFLVIPLIPLTLLANVFNSIVLGMQKFFLLSVFKVSADFLSLLFLFFALVALNARLTGAVLANVLAALAIVLVLFRVLFVIIGGIDWNLSKEYWKDLFLYGFQSYLGGLLGFLHYRIDVLFVSVLLGSVSVGYYSLAASVAEGLWIVSSAAATVLFPRVASERDEQHLKKFTPMVARNVFSLTLAGSFLLFLLGRWIIPLFYSSSFMPALTPLYILLPGVAFMSITAILANDYAGRGRPMLNVYLAGCAVAVNILLNIILIPRFGIHGAALASTLSYTAFTILSMFVYQRISGNSIRSLLFLQASDLRLYALFLKVCARNFAAIFRK